MGKSEEEAVLPPDRITPAQAGEILGMRGASTIYRWVSEGKLRAWRVGGRVWLSQADVMGKIRKTIPFVEAVPHEKLLACLKGGGLVG
jgi:excisionase family DNA binding protein